MRPIARSVLVDVDGTLLDVRRKYWQSHVTLARRLGEDPGDQTRFWQAKQVRTPLSMLLQGWGEASVAEYAAWWPEIIESPRMTSLDTAMEGAVASLAKLRISFRVVAISMRRKPQLLRNALARCGLDRHLVGCVLLEASWEGALSPGKHDLLMSSRFAHDDLACVVGDSDDDVKLARRLGVPCIAVLSGLRSEAYLNRLGPDLIIDSIAGLPEALDNLLASVPSRGASAERRREEC